MKVAWEYNECGKGSGPGWWESKKGKNRTDVAYGKYASCVCIKLP